MKKIEDQLQKLKAQNKLLEKFEKKKQDDRKIKKSIFFFIILNKIL